MSDLNLSKRKKIGPLSNVGFLVFLNLILLVFLTGTVFSRFLTDFKSKVAGDDKANVLGTEVSVSGRVPLKVDFAVSHEDGISGPGSCVDQVDFQIRNPGSTTALYSESVDLDNSESGETTEISTAAVKSGTYDIAVKGYSSLRHVFKNQNLNGAIVGLDLSIVDLLGGDSNPTSDNYVNGLDVAYQASNLYSTDSKADINNDCIVNSLDFPAMISNLYLSGDK